MGNNNGGFRYSNAHSNYSVGWPFKTEHSACKAVVTRGVTLPYFCDSRYICDSRYVVHDSMVWCKKDQTCVILLLSHRVLREGGE